MKKIILISLIALMIIIISIQLSITFLNKDNYQYKSRDINKLEMYKKSNNELLIHELKENKEFEINSDGYRGELVPLKKDNNSYRIIVLGDSVTFPEALKNKESYSYLLEKKLNNNSSKKIEILNFGVIGYDMIQYFERLKEKGLKYKPDMVIIGYILNDIGIYFFNEEIVFYGSPNSDFASKIELNNREKIIEKETKAKPICRLERILSINPYYIKTKNKNKIDPEEAYSDIHPYFYENECYWKRTKTYFQKFEEISKEYNFTISFVMIPSTHQNKNKSKEVVEVYNKILTEAKNHNFHIIEILEEFEKFEQKDLMMIQNPGEELDYVHPNKKGHQIIADKIFNELKNII